MAQPHGLAGYVKHLQLLRLACAVRQHHLPQGLKRIDARIDADGFPDQIGKALGIGGGMFQLFTGGAHLGRLDRL